MEKSLPSLGVLKLMLLMKLLEKEKQEELTVRETKMKELLRTDEQVRAAVTKAKRNSGQCGPESE